MGRFASTVEFYARYREPYPAKFFTQIAERLGLKGNESLLDIGCGPGLLAIGFAPFVKHGTGIDPELAMIAAARAAAAEVGAALTLMHGRIEQFSVARVFDLVTIGRALHWLDRDAALPVLERIVSVSGRILICGAFNADSPVSPWRKPYEDLRRSWADDPDERRYRLDGKTWFANSCFAEIASVSATKRRPVAVQELVGRALSKSNTSPARLGERRAAFEAAIAAVLQPFARNGVLEEQIVARASVFARS